MSKKVQAEVRCQKCSHQFATTLFRSIWIEYPENRKLVFEDKINVIACPRCGHASRLAFPLLATNVKEHIAVWYEPYHDPAIDSDMEQYRKHTGQRSFFSTAPRVRDWQAFKDTIVELEQRTGMKPASVFSEELNQTMNAFVESLRLERDKAAKQPKAAEAEVSEDEIGKQRIRDRYDRSQRVLSSPSFAWNQSRGAAIAWETVAFRITLLLSGILFAVFICGAIAAANSYDDWASPLLYAFLCPLFCAGVFYGGRWALLGRVRPYWIPIDPAPPVTVREQSRTSEGNRETEEIGRGRAAHQPSQVTSERLNLDTGEAAVSLDEATRWFIETRVTKDILP